MSDKEKKREYQKKYYQKNKERIIQRTAQWNKNNNHKHQFRQQLKKRYNMTLDDYDLMFELQGGKCAICSQPEQQEFSGVVRRLSVDHNHKNGKVRKLLCQRCNAAIGMVKENIGILLNIIEYLNEYK